MLRSIFSAFSATGCRTGIASGNNLWDSQLQSP
jgi:hypothetical protein